MARRTFADDLILLPWWVLLILAALTYVGLKFWLPTFHFQNPVHQGFVIALPQMAGMISSLFALLACVSAFRRWKRGDLLEKQTSRNSIQDLPWREFEFLISEAYKRLGYVVQENASAGPDDGVDLVLVKEGRKTLVQCKNWRNAKVGVSVVRELLGSMTAMGAAHGVVVCSGEFTQPAREFALENNIDLVTGTALTKLIGKVQTKPTIQSVSRNVGNECPICQAHMVRRTAKRGKNAGASFWGCSRYPKCRGTRS